MFSAIHYVYVRNEMKLSPAFYLKRSVTLGFCVVRCLLGVSRPGGFELRVMAPSEIRAQSRVFLSRVCVFAEAILAEARELKPVKRTYPRLVFPSLWFIEISLTRTLTIYDNGPRYHSAV